MARSQSAKSRHSNHQPVSKSEYILATLASCRKSKCCQDRALIDAAYEQYVNDPRAPWNQQRHSNRRVGSRGRGD